MTAPEELHRVLCAMAAEITGEPASGFLVQKLKGDASSRSYYRLRSGASSLVAMVLPEEATKSEEIGQTRTSAEPGQELPFLDVHRYLALGGTPVPAIHRTDLRRGVLILEDLGDETLEVALQQASPQAREALYTEAIELLIAMRLHGERHPDSHCIAFRRAFDRSLYRSELEHYLEYGFIARTGKSPSPTAARVMATAFDDLAERLAGEPRSFTHRDYQSRNLMRGPRGFTVIDFQDALLGPRPYDLVALLRDSYIELPEGLIEKLIDLYGARTDSPATFRRTFDLLTVQRKLKDAGRFEFIDRVKKNPSFLPYVASSLRYVARALERLPEYGELLTVLRDVHPEMSGEKATFSDRAR
jgi:aminoglycoside/choline kinase family phosphotransferase